ncbi:IS1 family transposase [Yersinia ruckeri]|uniref:IS1 family transposase n=1 Tax=Yersinia ruckeri TaxID=29486 RepID=UPI0008FD23C6|nr:hypothetical protein [Yersinia ruckeri]
MPKDNHRISKTFTQRIERNNLALRTRIKRLWPEKQSASHARLKSHEKVIGNFIKNICSTHWNHYHLGVIYILS